MSSRKSNLKRFQNFTAADMSSASLTSPVTNIQWLDNIGLQMVWTGAPVGTFDVQVSIDYDQDNAGNVINAGTWDSIPLSPAITASGSGSSAYIDLNQLSAPWIRVVYTKTSGTGTLNGYITAKEV